MVLLKSTRCHFFVCSHLHTRKKLHLKPKSLSQKVPLKSRKKTILCNKVTGWLYVFMYVHKQLVHGILKIFRVYLIGPVKVLGYLREDTTHTLDSFMNKIIISYRNIIQSLNRQHLQNWVNLPSPFSKVSHVLE